MPDRTFPNLPCDRAIERDMALGESILYGQFEGSGSLEGGLIESCRPTTCTVCGGARFYEEDGQRWPCGWCKASGLEPTTKPAITPSGDGFSEDGL